MGCDKRDAHKTARPAPWMRPARLRLRTPYRPRLPGCGMHPPYAHPPPHPTVQFWPRSAPATESTYAPGAARRPLPPPPSPWPAAADPASRRRTRLASRSSAPPARRVPPARPSPAPA
eukprot:scaffold2325_cov105-Isochrysis_galbana.AAC.12